MQRLFEEVEKELPLLLERETDCRETWPKRWALLKSKVEKCTGIQHAQAKMPTRKQVSTMLHGLELPGQLFQINDRVVTAVHTFISRHFGRVR